MNGWSESYNIVLYDKIFLECSRIDIYLIQPELPCTTRHVIVFLVSAQCPKSLFYISGIIRITWIILDVAGYVELFLTRIKTFQHI